METAMKVSTSFRLNAELVEKMKAAAKASNRSLNNFVESILLNVMSHETAENTTLAAIEEAKAQQLPRYFHRKITFFLTNITGKPRYQHNTD